MSRISLPSPDDMTAEQLAVYHQIVSGPRGKLIGPLRAVMHSPDLAARWSKLGEFMRFSTCLPPKLNELAIIVTGRRWNSQLEFYVHAEAGRQAGLGAEAIEAIRIGAAPIFAEQAELDIYEFARHLQRTGVVPIEVYRAVEARWGARGVVELTGVIGYYTMVSMTLNAHELPLMEGAKPPLSPVAGPGLTSLPPGRLAA
ncbi:MAG: carboxymuconolactone decarboxylase family protein [Rhodopila sp.]|jgi:4-carboxymuconolactone decarboxylase